VVSPMRSFGGSQQVVGSTFRTGHPKPYGYFYLMMSYNFF
jgi:hypothetical protein